MSARSPKEFKRPSMAASLLVDEEEKKERFSFDADAEDRRSFEALMVQSVASPGIHRPSDKLNPCK